ncbi:hypothetical protein AA313_de0200751 [Arthrobotrys entomopaga]|nr:hypothetical protein AA313_de0200751 [Arthrobotrys entomopaga]
MLTHHQSALDFIIGFNISFRYENMNSTILHSSPGSIFETLSLTDFTPKTIALYSVLAALLPLVYTFTVTTLNDGKPTKEGEPPVPPYWVPFIAHGFGLMRGMDKMLTAYRYSL